MGIGIGLSGSSVERADLYYNDNGTIRDIDDYDVWINESGRFIKLPQKDKLILNLDHNSFSTNVIKSASSYITKNFELWQHTTQKTHMGDKVTSDPGDVNDMRINIAEKYWFINNLANVNLFWSGVDILSDRKVTINITCRFSGIPSKNWRQLFWFENSDQFRIEHGEGNLFLFGENDLITDNGQNFMIPTIDNNRDRTNWFTLTVVVDGVNVTVYQNRKEVKTGVLSRELSTNINKVYLCGQRGANNTDTFGAKVYFRNIAVWKTSLTKSELDDYWELAPSVGPSLVTP